MMENGALLQLSKQLATAPLTLQYKTMIKRTREGQSYGGAKRPAEE